MTPAPEPREADQRMDLPGTQSLGSDEGISTSLVGQAQAGAMVTDYCERCTPTGYRCIPRRARPYRLSEAEVQARIREQ
jgi:hypothetical protein